MSILHRLKNEDSWQQLLNAKRDGGHLSAREEKELVAFIECKGYLPVVDKILGRDAFPLPTVKEINKKHSGKKRTVFVFDQAENLVLKLIAHLLGEYDTIFPDNLYSFRKDICVKTAVARLVSATGGTPLYTYKADIHDYFNSVHVETLLPLLDEALADDPMLKDFIKALLLNPYSVKDGETVTVKKGIMAGVPISGFLANLYLSDLDRRFAHMGAIYARYSDDVIVFAETEEEITRYEAIIKTCLEEKQLEINPKKKVRTVPFAPWEFLGFRIDGQSVDISKIALEKIKDKIRRKARALLRWKKRKGASDERAVRAFIRHFNKKFYANADPNDITWCRWYFPALTTADSLHLIDEYMLACIRHVASGKYTKANYNLRYDTVKSLGYRSLVNGFYKYKKTGALPY